MLSVPVYNTTGQQVGAAEIDEQTLGGTVNARLLKQAVVMYHANQRQGTLATKSRGDVAGSTRKIYRQKGTGRARMGPVRTPQRRGGGRAFAKRPRDFRQAMPKKMRRLARDNAVLAKIQSQDAVIVEGLKMAEPRTKPFAALLAALQAQRGCVVATAGVDAMVHKSGRNIPRTEITDVAALNAMQILTRRKLIFTREAFELFKQMAAGGGSSE